MSRIASATVRHNRVVTTFLEDRKAERSDIAGAGTAV